MRNSPLSLNKYDLVTLWLLLIFASGAWNIYQRKEAQNQLYLETARSFFSLIVTTREWNSSMGGVYVPVSEKIQPNPYLDIPDRDLQTTNGTALTKINPAYMTRLIAELAEKNNSVRFHITSLNPIRPANAPESWEIPPLQSFEKNFQSEFAKVDTQSRKYLYMAPLITQESCLACHARQGYKVGDVRGGISITLNTQPLDAFPIVVSHVLIALSGSLVILFFSTRLNNAIALLQKQSRIDGLTQIYNRGFFDEYLHREYLRCRRNKNNLSILLCDVDLFKDFNDAYGHQAGDYVLKKIARSLSTTLRRPGDLAARYGGEEFGIVLPDTPPDGALVIAEMLRASIEALQIPHQGNTVSKMVTISIGVYTYQGDALSIDEILSRADKALYRAKEKGRNIVCSYSHPHFTGDQTSPT
ncbi:MAG TPA: diguanylate cyclase [Anaerolineaceae bacterium]